MDRIGGSGVGRLLRLAREHGRAADPVVRQRLAGLWCEEKVREWTNERVRANARAGRPPGAESSIGKVHGAELNQRVQLLATDLLGARATAWVNGATSYEEGLPYELSGMLRSRANTIEGGTSEVNRNILGEHCQRVLLRSHRPLMVSGNPNFGNNTWRKAVITAIPLLSSVRISMLCAWNSVPLNA